MRTFLEHKKNTHIIILFFILFLALFFRTYDIVNRFEFAHDGDLYSWIVKDIVIDKHFRLIGQLTSAHGIFIGPAFYYTLIPFFLLFKMDPLGATIPITAIGIATVASYYWVFSRLFNRTAGLIGAFLYAILLSPVYSDMRVVPSTPTNLWLVWYFYTIVMITRGKYSVLPILGLLVGLIWHIHIALAPALIAVMVAMLVSRKFPARKEVLLSFFAFLVPSIPLILFEVRHDFLQTLSFIRDLRVDHHGGNGLYKGYQVLVMISNNINRLFLYPQGFTLAGQFFLCILVLLSGVFLVKKKLLRTQELVVFYIWILVIILYYTRSSTYISEYYFTNIEIIFFSFVVLFLSLIFKSRAGKFIVLGVLALVLIKNTFHFISHDIFKKGYVERKAIAKYIAEDAREKGFPCVAVSYITSLGEDVGFRYFFWLNNLHVNQAKSGSPVYTIVLPVDLAPGDVQAKFGDIGVIPPKDISSRETIATSCSGQNSNLTDPMFGFTQ